MEVINGDWFLTCADSDDPYRLKSVSEAIEYIKAIGFVPLFESTIPALSIERRTAAYSWWSGNEDADPWEWRRVIAASGEIAYGKFFSGKAGFVSLEWFPHFMNFRRDGYDFDAAWDDGKVNYRQKKVMDCFAENTELFSNMLKKKSGLTKEEQKHFDYTASELQMMTYLCIKDFRQRLNKQGMPYGWPLTVYTTPEEMWGYDFCSSCYKYEPEESRELIFKHLKDEYPIATDKQINDFLK